MEDLAKVRIAILKEIKQIRRFFDSMEDGVKKRNTERTKKAYAFLKILVFHMDKGHLTPDFVELCHHIWEYDLQKIRHELESYNEKN